jgi:O-antigen/teichoic acid export membrane protein
MKSSASLARPSKETARSLFDFAKFSAVNAAGWRIFSWIDVLVIGLFLTQNFVGAYEIAWKVTSMTMMLAASIRTVIFPQISSWDAEGKVDDIEALLPKLLLGSLFFVIPAFFGSLVLSRNILVTVFGEGYGIVALAMSVLMLQKVVQATSAVVGQSLQAVDQPKLVAIAMVIGATTNIVMNVLLITQFGVVGAAVATFTSYTLMTILQVQYLSQFVSITVPAAELGWCTVASVVMVGAVYLVKASFSIGNISKLIATIVFGAFVYLAIIALNPAIRIKIANSVDAVVGQS